MQAPVNGVDSEFGQIPRSIFNTDNNDFHWYVFFGTPGGNHGLHSGDGIPVYNTEVGGNANIMAGAVVSGSSILNSPVRQKIVVPTVFVPQVITGS